MNYISQFARTTCVLALTVMALHASPILYSVDQGNPNLYTVDPFTAATLTTIGITTGVGTVTGSTGLAADPNTGTLYALLKLQGQSGRSLATINPLTGVATVIGDTGDNFAGLAFDAAGTLYGVTGDGATTPETLFTINTATGAATLFLALGAGDDGEAIAFNPVDGLLYHASGHTGDCDRLNDDGVCFETVNLGTLAITDIDITGSALTGEETQALTWWANQGVFLWKQNHGSGPLFSVTPAGVPTLIGQLDHQSKGLAFADAPAVPEPATVSLIGLGIGGLLLVQRKRRRA